MSNDFYNNEANTLVTGAIAKATDLEGKFDEVVSGFEKLPGEAELNRGIVSFADDVGITDHYAVSMHQTPTEYTDNMEVVFKTANANTGACTINVDSLGVKSIKLTNGDDPGTSDFPAGCYVHLRYDADEGYFLVMATSAHEDRITALEFSVYSALVAGSGCPVSANDQTAGYLNGKLIAGNGVTLTENNDGAGETLEISLTEDATDMDTWDQKSALVNEVIAWNGAKWVPFDIYSDVRKTIALTVFNLSVVNGLTVQEMDDGFFDEYEDATGITTATEMDLSDDGYYLNYDLGWILHDAVYNDSYFELSGQEVNPGCMRMNPAGTKMFVLFNTGDIIYEYDLATAWKPSTAVYNSVSYTFSETATPRGFDFSLDGSKMYVGDYINNTIYQYTLDSEYDLSDTVTYASKNSGAISQISSSLLGFKVNPAGTKLHCCDAAGVVYQYTLTLGHIDTISYDSVSLALAGVQDLAWKDDGTKAYFVCDASTNAIRQYSTSAYSLAGASVDTSDVILITQDTSPASVCISSLGTKIYMAGSSTDSVFEYSLNNGIIKSATSTLVSASVTASIEPDNIFAILRQEDVDSVTLNTDLLLSASRDGGSTWTTGTLVEYVDSGQRVLTSEIDISAQPSGTTMAYKIETANSKRQNIHAAALQWS